MKIETTDVLPSFSPNTQNGSATMRATILIDGQPQMLEWELRPYEVSALASQAVNAVDALVKYGVKYKTYTDVELSAGPQAAVR